MPPRDLSYLWDILRAASHVQETVQQISLEDFAADWHIYELVERQFITIGEATKRLSTEIRVVHPDIPWTRMAGLRDILTHGYDHIDLTRLWEIATVDLPDIIPSIEYVVSLLREGSQ